MILFNNTTEEMMHGWLNIQVLLLIPSGFSETHPS